MKKLKLTRVTAIIIGVLIAVPLLIFGFLTYFGVFSRASSQAPVDVIITKITTQSATISWTTDQETQGTVEYGTSATQLTFFSPEPVKTQTHSVDLTLLTPGTTHFFVIRIGDEVYDNAGVPWSFTTKADTAKEATPSEELESTPSAEVTVEVEATKKPTPKAGSPTLTPPGAKPTLKSSTPTPRPTTGGTTVSCSSNDCDRILANLGPGKCTVTDYQKCRGRTVTPTATPLISNTPTASPTPSGPVLYTPGNLQAVAYSSSNITLTWFDKSLIEEGYVVERASWEAQLIWKNIATLPGVSGQNNEMTFTDTGSDLSSGNLGSGRIYKYRVAGFKTSDDGETVYYSNYTPDSKGTYTAPTGTP